MNRCGRGPEMFYPANAGGDTHQYREERRTWRAPKETGWDPKWARGSVETLILPESRRYDSPRKMGRLGNNKSPKFEAEKSLGALSFFIVFIVGLYSEGSRQRSALSKRISSSSAKFLRAWACKRHWSWTGAHTAGIKSSKR